VTRQNSRRHEDPRRFSIRSPTQIEYDNRRWALAEPSSEGSPVDRSAPMIDFVRLEKFSIGGLA
jgi:hypothetical protein